MPTGVDRSALQKLQRQLRAAASQGDGLYDRAKKACAAAAITELSLGFRESRNPYGEPWAPLKVRRGKPLIDTGRLRSSFTVSFTPTGFRIGTNVDYAASHQYGTGGRKSAGTRFQPVGSKGRFISADAAGRRKRGSVGVRALSFSAGSGAIPARMMVPEGSLGPIWAKAFRDAVAAVIRAWRVRIG